MNTERRQAIVRTLRGRISSANVATTVFLSPTIVGEIVGELEAEHPFGVPTHKQRQLMLEVLEVYMHSKRNAETALDAMLRAAAMGAGDQGEKVSGFMPFHTTR